MKVKKTSENTGIVAPGRDGAGRTHAQKKFERRARLRPLKQHVVRAAETAKNGMNCAPSYRKLYEFCLDIESVVFYIMLLRGGDL